jgi:isocitrate dehydrogenase kinase/phosphatase
MSSRPWYTVGPNDVFPEEFRLFFSGNARARKAFDQLHNDLYEASFWTNLQDKLRDGFVKDFFPYSSKLRFQR